MTDFGKTPQSGLEYFIHTVPKAFTFAHFTETADCDYTITYTLSICDSGSCTEVTSAPTDVIQSYTLYDAKPSAN